MELNAELILRILTYIETKAKGTGEFLIPLDILVMDTLRLKQVIILRLVLIGDS